MARLRPHPHVVRYHASWVRASRACNRSCSNETSSKESTPASSACLLIAAALLALQVEGVTEDALQRQAVRPCAPSEGSVSTSASTWCGRSLEAFEPPAGLPCWDRGLLDGSPVPAASVEPPGAASPRRRQPPLLRPVLVIQMELCDGTTLADWLSCGGGSGGESESEGSTLQERLQVVHQVLEGVAHLHASGVEHGDLSPRNIFRAAADGARGTPARWCVGDFTFARTSDAPRALAVAGTPLYAAPELAGPADGGGGGAVPPSSPQGPLGACDVFSAGLIAAEACLRCGTRMEVAQVLHELRGLRPDASLPARLQTTMGVELAGLIRRMVAADPRGRPSMAEVLQAWPRVVEAARQELARHRSKDEEPAPESVWAGFSAHQRIAELQEHLMGLGASGAALDAGLRSQLTDLRDLLSHVLAAEPHAAATMVHHGTVW